MNTALLSMMMLTSISMMTASHPLTLSLLTLIQAILIALFTNIISFTSWFSYIMFLIMIGAMLILFLYMTSVASNEKFKISLKIILMSMTLIIMLYMYMMFKQQTTYYNLSFLSFLDEYETNMQMIKLYNFPSNMIFIMMVIYLLICLIAIVKITESKQGPLRQSF